jgi:glycosyltransferase involved in cell wall biosynthesis
MPLLSRNPTQIADIRMPRPDRQIMLFDMAVTGHHSVYIKHLIQHWQTQQLPGLLHVVVIPQFLERHADVVAIVSSGSNIRFTAISESEYGHFDEQKSLMTRGFAEWKLFCQYARQLQVTQGLLMQFDIFQIPLMLQQPAPCDIAGIYFRPTFHYREFAHYQPTRSDLLRQWRQKLILSLALRHPQVKQLFSLDPFAVKSIAQLGTRVATIPLPDPVENHDYTELDPEQLRRELGIQPGRKVFLLFGEISQRKGIYPLLEAVQSLSSEMGRQICLLVAGPIEPSEQESVQAALDRLAASPSVQLMTRIQYVKGREVQRYFALADVILVLYQRHVGMSSVLVHAAAAQKPVLASDYGLLGELVQRHQLGVVVNAESHEAIASGIISYLVPSLESLCNQQKMNAFAKENTHEKFSVAIFSNLG